MSARPVLIALLLAALVAADAVTWSQNSAENFPHPLSIAHFALGFSQINLLAICAALGGLHFGLRLPAAAVLAAGLTVFLHHGSLETWAALIGFQMAIVVLPLLAIRGATGLRLEVAAGETDRRFVERRPVQFSLLNLMLATTLIGVACGAAKLLWQLFSARQYWSIVEPWAIGGGMAATGLAAAWFGLGGGRWFAKCATLVVVTGCAGWLIAVTAGGSRPTPIFLLVVVQALLLAGSLGVLRIAGYRLTRRRPRRQTAAPRAADGPFDREPGLA